MIMLLSKGQVIRFRGRDGQSRAASLARELQGHCKVTGGEVELTKAAELAPRVFDVRFPSRTTQFTAGDFR